MAKIDETRPFKPVHIAVMTVSDSRTEANDTSGQALVDLIARQLRLKAAGHGLHDGDSGVTPHLASIGG